jgi:hypothetical protein
LIGSITFASLGAKKIGKKLRIARALKKSIRGGRVRLRERQGRNFRRRKKGHERTEEEETNKKFERKTEREKQRKTEKGVKRRVIGNGIQRDRGDKKRRAMADVAKRRGHSTTENLDSTHVRFVIRFIWS